MTDSGDDRTAVIVGTKLRQDKELVECIRILNIKYVYSDTGFEHIKRNVIFVLDNFDGDIFTKLRELKAKIYGPPVLKRCARYNENLPESSRPQYCCTMRNVVLCFTGFKQNREQLSRLADLVHHMGGSIRRDYTPKVTHLVANCAGGEKYRHAVCFGKNIMAARWVSECWNVANDIARTADDLVLMTHKIRPFTFCVLCFYGISNQEKIEMEQLADQNDGRVVDDAESPLCTHLVVGPEARDIPFELHPQLHVVRAEWFWGCLQMEATADENLYKYEATKSTSSASPATPGTKTRKRKRALKENLAHLAAGGRDSSLHIVPLPKRKSNGDQASFSSSLIFDASIDNELSPVHTPSKTPVIKVPLIAKDMSKRQKIAIELLETERNYVHILAFMITVKDELENTDQPGGAILAQHDVRDIFGSLQLIYDVHFEMLKKLNQLINNWKEDCKIGQVIVQNVSSIEKAYPPFINYQDRTAKRIAECDMENGRFHAFQKRLQSRSDGIRESITELIIRPVQRLPSMKLLLENLLANTPETHDDHECLKDALKKLHQVTSKVNEGKKTIDDRFKLFELNEKIEGLPPTCLSSNRHFLKQINACELTETTGSGQNLTLFLFDDILILAKRRKTTVGATPQRKTHKFLKEIHLGGIKRVVDIKDADMRGAFGLIVCDSSDKERLIAFLLPEEELITKKDFLVVLCKQVSRTQCTTDYENILAHGVDASLLHLDTPDSHNRTLSRAARSLSKRVSRAFSFSRTPRKLQRAVASVSHVMSPRMKTDTLNGKMTPTLDRPMRTGTSSASMLDLAAAQTLDEDIIEVFEDEVGSSPVLTS